MKNCFICNNRTKIIMKDVYKCSQCKHLFRDYSKDGVNYHVNIFRKQKGLRSKDEIINEKVNNKFHLNRQDIVNKRFNLISKYLNKDFNLLDIGSGAGTFVERIKNSVKNIECTELSPILINECERLGYKTYKKDFLEINFNKKYDIVTIWHVLEHIKDVNKFVTQVSKITKNLLIIEIPTLESKECKKKRKLKSPNISFDGHYHYFSIQSLTKLFENEYNIIDINEKGVQQPCIFMVLKKKII